MKGHIVGGGLASLAAAAYLIRDGGLPANNVHVYEAGESLGGAMGIAGGPLTGYVLPTGRIFEEEYRCTFELFSIVPSASDPETSIKDDILAFNARYRFRDRAHIIDRDGKIIKGSHYGLSIRDRLDLIRLALMPEAMLEDRRIDEYFGEDFFRTEFWLLFVTILGSLPRHSAMEMRRYIHRFLHWLPYLSDMTKMYRTRYNQYEAIVEPLVEWLQRQGVNFLTGAFVQRIAFAPSPGRITANAMEYVRDGAATVVEIESGDVVLVTNGSQTTDLSVGSMMAPPNPRSLQVGIAAMAAGLAPDQHADVARAKRGPLHCGSRQRSLRCYTPREPAPVKSRRLWLASVGPSSPPLLDAGGEAQLWAAISHKTT